MPARVALLRGVNVSGANKLPMAGFRDLLAELGLGQASTYIQSGNAVFESYRSTAELEDLIRDAIAARFGFAPEVFVLGADAIRAAMTDHPFAGAEPSRVHVFFLKEAPALDNGGLNAFARPGDGWHLSGARFTLHSPAGISTSRLADKLPGLLASPVTARNLRTVSAIDSMLADLAHP